MGAMLRYFRDHPWQRRVTTLCLAGILGLLAAAVVAPHVRNQRLIRALTDSDVQRREAAIWRAQELARRSPRFRLALNEALDTPDDTRFDAIAGALVRLRLFHVPGRSPEAVDRLKRIAFARLQPKSPSPAGGEDDEAPMRHSVIRRFILDRRTGAETHRLLLLAAADPAASVRREAALLAVMADDGAAIGALADDTDASVRSRLWTDLGLAGRGDFADRIARAFAGAAEGPEAPAAAYALAILGPNETARLVAERIRSEPPGVTLEKLLWVATMLPRQEAGASVIDALGRATAGAEAAGPAEGDNLSAAMAILAAGHLRLPEAGSSVLAALEVSGVEDAVRRRTTLASAAWAARRLDLPAGSRLKDLMKTAFGQETSLAMIEAAGSLSVSLRTAASPSAAAEVSRAEAIETLTAAASRTDVPLAAAAAALALWQVEPGAGERAIVQAAQAEGTLGGDWLAWHVAGSDPAAGERIARALLEVPYDNNAKAAGAMMLALAVRRPDRAADAMALLRERFGPDEAPKPSDGMLLESYRCALHLLGESRHVRRLNKLLAGGGFPQRRLLTALLLTGDRAGTDWLLANGQYGPSTVSYLLGNKTIGEVLHAARGDLPRFEPLASPRVRLWLAEIIQDAYLLSEAGLGGVFVEGRPTHGTPED